VDQFISKNNLVSGKEITGISTDSMSVLINYDYPGNVRELENIIEHACVLCPVGQIFLDYLPRYILDSGSSPDEAVSEDRQPESGLTIEDMETRLIRSALQKNKGNRVKAAKDLGIHKTTLYRKMKKLGITPKDSS
jgi:transcriptional regulator with PAS, ATPase and Fis domain